MSDFSNAV